MPTSTLRSMLRAPRHDATVICCECNQTMIGTVDSIGVFSPKEINKRHMHKLDSSACAGPVFWLEGHWSYAE